MQYFFERDYMPKELYELIALSLRYFFIFILALIAFRCYFWQSKDKRAWKRFKKALPSAGFVGEIYVVYGNDKLKANTRIDLPQEGVIGNSLICDVILPSKNISKRQAYFRLDINEGLYLELLDNSEIMVDDLQLNKKHQKAYVLHGSELRLAEFKLKVFFYRDTGIKPVSYVAHDPRVQLEDNANQATIVEQDFANRYIQEYFSNDFHDNSPNGGES